MKPLAKTIRRYFSLKESAIVLAAIVVSIAVGVGVFLSLKKEVVINDDGKQAVVKTMKTTVGEVLEQSGISVSPDDYINLPLNTVLQKTNKNEIYIKRAVPINVEVAGQVKKLMTYKETVKDALAFNSIELSKGDKLLGADPGDKVEEGMSIKVIKVKKDLITEKLSVPYRTIARANSRMNRGKEVVVRDGIKGKREKTYRVTYEDGKQVKKELIKDSIVSAPVNRLVEYGTTMNLKTSRGEVVRYSRCIEMNSTTYTASFADTGKRPGDPGFGITASGMRVRKGVVAVDPRVIPLGTKLYIEGIGNTPDYGFAIAADTGGAVKGNKIDLYFEPKSLSFAWGIRPVKVYILKN